jgi:hypothetical protein
MSEKLTPSQKSLLSAMTEAHHRKFLQVNPEVALPLAMRGLLEMMPRDDRFARLTRAGREAIR